MLSGFDNSIQSGLWIVRLKVSYRRINMYHFVFSSHADRHTNHINKKHTKIMLC